MIHGWAMAQTLKVAGAALAGSMAALGYDLWAQLSATDSIGEWVAGGTLFIAAGLIVRWVVSTSKKVEERWLGEIERLEKKNSDLERRLRELRTERDDWQSKYWLIWAQLHGRTPQEEGGL